MDDPARQKPPPQIGNFAAAEGSHLDEETRDRLRRGGQAALAREFLRHRHRLRRMIEVRLDRRLLGRVDPSEVLEEAFLEAVRRLDQYLAQPPMPLFLWFRYLIGQRILAWHERLLGQQAEQPPSENIAGPSIRRPQADSASLSMHLAGQFNQDGQIPQRQNISVHIEQIISQLDPLDREILALRHFEQLNNQEVAEELGLSPATASHRYIQALEKLGALLNSLPEFQKR
ncbi:MAG: sigma-70 family RNA polymerase sigma factor [Thermoguttaceae bacterium]|nr:sigma-70 family RNA polymerase sigma factor [Thermoguttaceae bacterium]MDW8038505.1 sigma-70 family RNA polymerase sigma factor [Thermoguttaceae bacterium]